VTSRSNPFGPPEGGNPQWDHAAGPDAPTARTPPPAPPERPRAQHAYSGRPAAGRPQSGRGVAALLCGIGGLFFLPLLLSVPAIILGASARRQIDASGGVVAGRNLATVGMWLGIIGVLWWGIILLLVMIAAAGGAAA
jgi:hypothetical protein